MALPSWWQVTTPHKDIQEGKLSEEIFAAKLDDVIYGKAPDEYQNPRTFFKQTYLTKGLENLLNNVSNRLQGKKSDSVIQLQTRFGGGKTHALVMLYHAIKNSKDLKGFVSPVKYLEKKKVKVAAFVGTHADPLKGKTPWGEIAHQLGLYEIVKEHDVKRVSPGKERLAELLKKSGPTLILIDELLEYIVKANRVEKVEKITHGQTLAFLQEISEIISSSKNSCLVITLPSSILERYDEEAERTLKQLQKISGRIETTYTPVEGMEIYEVIRKRLFEDIGDEKTRKKTADDYSSLYQKLGTDLPSEVKEQSYRERIEKAYPFHPELIDVLETRWGSFPTFQRTRGVLRLLAEVVADLYKSKVVSPLIQSSIINFENPAIRIEFVKHIGNEFEAVIESDIAGKSANAKQVDKEMGSEYKKYNIAQGVATTTFLYSFSGGESQDTTLPRIRLALLREGIPSTIVGDAIAKLEEELWYFHSEKGKYSFRNQPNLNRVIADREESIKDDEVYNSLKSLVQKNAGNSLEVYPWPENSYDIPDNSKLKLALLSPNISHKSKGNIKLVDEIFKKSGLGFRAYKNTLFVLSVDENQYLTLTKTIRRFLALSKLIDEKNLLKTLTKEAYEELKSKLSDSESQIPFSILTCYRHLSSVENGGVKDRDIGIPTVGSFQTISERVKQYLIDQGRLLNQVSAKYLIDTAFGKDEKEKSLREIYELYLKTPGMLIPENEMVLLNAIQSGVKNGIVGLQEGEEVFYKEDITPSLDSIVLTAGIAKERKQKEEQEEIEEEHEEKPTKKSLGKVTKLFIRAKVPWDKLSSVISGVIGPLQDKGDDPDVTIEINSKSSDGFDRTTLDSKAKETLQQIGAEIEDWEEN